MKKGLILCCLVVFFACKEKQTDFSGDTALKPAEFLSAFKPITSNVLIADTNLVKSADTLRLAVKVLQQFFADSILNVFAGKDKKTVIQPLGVIKKEKEWYLLLNFTRKKTTSLVVFVTDPNLKYLGAKLLLTNQYQDGYRHSVNINREPTFLISQEKALPSGDNKFSRAGWVYNDAGLFMIVVNDSNEDPKKTKMINPIDTLPRNNKFSGNYVRNEKNYISIRDGKNAGTYLFFIYFEKNNGSCTGELKGEMKLAGDNKATFSENGDPCIIDFSFEGSYVRVKERGSCGNHRGIKCFFDDSFIKKKEPRKRKKKS